MYPNDGDGTSARLSLISRIKGVVHAILEWNMKRKHRPLLFTLGLCNVCPLLYATSHASSSMQFARAKRVSIFEECRLQGRLKSRNKPGNFIIISKDEIPTKF